MRVCITKLLEFSLLVISGIVLSGCNSSNETEVQRETKMQEEQKNNQENVTNTQDEFVADMDSQFDEFLWVNPNPQVEQEPLPEDLNATLFAVLEEPRKWVDDQIHAGDWMRFLQLIKAGAPVNQQDAYGLSIWNHVITAPIPNEPGTDVTQELLQRAEVVEELLKRGASVEETMDEYGNTALMHTSSEGQLPIVKVLLKHKANVNAVNSNGNTALLLAVGPHYEREPGYPPTIKVSYENQAPIVQALLQAGAGVTVKNKAGKTALMLAQDKHEEINKDNFYQVVRSSTEDESRKEIINLLKSAGAKE